MHIKRIVIQGFKTYKNTTVIDLISPEFNVVVGRNGSGKSNFFSAIRFALSDAYTHMTREERQGLIHEGNGTVMSAYVEIVFDNTDRRLPINRDEVTVRRTIGLKKDDYSLDGKNATRSDIMNLLESGGFSRANPYYIVPQGKITSLTNSKDAERLALLKDVSGAKVFELKLKESKKEMANSNMKRQRIDETLSSINDRLGDLQIESNDLKQFQDLDKNRKIFAYNLYDRELNDLNNEISGLELQYEENLDKSQAELNELETREKICKRLNEEIDELKGDVKILKVENHQNVEYYESLLLTISAKEVELKELNVMYDKAVNSQADKEEAIKKYQSSINKSRDHIKQYKPKLVELHQQETAIKGKLIELTTKQRALYSKQNRFSKFSDKKTRDKWIQGQIVKFQKDLAIKEVEIARLDDNISNKREVIKGLEIKLEEMKKVYEEQEMQKTEQLKTLKKEIAQLKYTINEISDKRKFYWREEIKLKSINDSLNNDLLKAKAVVNQTMDRQQLKGLDALEEIVKRLRLTDSVYGPLIKLFTVSDKYKMATEVIAGNSLFHVVVDTDETASLLMEELVRTKSGRVTFIPLNRINPPNNVQYPDPNEYQCVALIKKIKFDNPKINKAINHVFSKTIVVSELSKGSELAKSFNLNAITLDGDKVERGSLSGGFRDYKQSRLDAIKHQILKYESLQENNQLIKECQANLEEINQKFTRHNSELQNHLKAMDEITSRSFSDVNNVKNQLFDNEQQLKSLESNYEAVLSIKQSLVTNIEQHKVEMASPFSELDQQELNTLQQLKREIDKYEKDLTKVINENSEIESKLATLETELLTCQNNIRQLEQMNVVEQQSVEQEQHEVQRLKNQLQQIKMSIDQSNETIETINDQINRKQQEVNKVNSSQIELITKIEGLRKTVETSLNKKLLLTTRKDELNKKLSDIGVLPEEAFDVSKFENIDNSELYERLTNINTQLTKYSHINKKAIEQYEVFTSQRDDLLQRRQELDDSKQSIETLIDNLSLQKDQAIEKSFNNVATSFSRIFKQLVPSGAGKLIITRDATDYTGVSISVSFNSTDDEQQLIEQLSGGQKSLCAITLILAIQSCDPAPFYLFDEIDANLDTQYRTAVAAMIRELSARAQFICTTFRPEMLAVADKFYGVTFNNKVSTVGEISRNDATDFIEGLTI